MNAYNRSHKLTIHLMFAVVVTSLSIFPGKVEALPDSQVTSHIILPYSAKVEITVNNAITNYCDGNFGIHSPTQQQIFPHYNNQRGETALIGPFNANTELVFYIQPLSFCSGYQYLSTNPAHARVHQISQGIWRIEWEDLPDNWPPDNDFDDLIVTIRLVGAYPDFKQDIGNWAPDIYDHNTEPEDNIARYGCAMTTIANLLAYYGARDMNPGALNTWMNDPRNAGYTPNGSVIWDSVSRYKPEGSDVSVIKWNRSISRNDPNIDFQGTIHDSLSNSWPVVLHYNMPSSPSGMHFVVAVTQTIQDEQEYYIVKDPNSFTNLARLRVNDPNIEGANLYSPADGITRPSLIIYGFSPIEVLVVDGQGRRLGYDPISGQEFWEIPEGNYAYNAPFWDPLEEEGSNEGENLTLEVPGAVNGNYRLMVYGTGEGQYQIETYYRSGQGDPATSLLSGTVQPATMIAYDIHAYNGGVNVQPTQALSISASPTSIPNGGVSTIQVRVVDGNGNPIQNRRVTFSATLGTITDSAFTNNNGFATVQFHAGMTPGVSRITAQADNIGTHIDVRLGNTLFFPIASR